MREESTRAIAEPINTHHIELALEDSSIVVNWVLSPSSARNTIIKAVTMDFHIF